MKALQRSGSKQLTLISRALLWFKYRVLGAVTDPYKVRYLNFRPRCGKDAVVIGIDSQATSIATLLERGDIELFLSRLEELVENLSSERLLGRALYVPKLDELACKAHQAIAASRNVPTDSKLLVYVLTTVYSTGGHTRVVEDIASALPDYTHLLVLTALEDPHSALAILKSRFEALRLKVHVLRGVSPAEKARELSRLIGSLAPQVVMLLAHPYDVIASVGVAGLSAPRVLFLHHSDHQPSLGASRHDYAHIDLTPACHSVCVSRPHLGATLLNLTAKDIGTVQLRERYPIIGVTCGRADKYAGACEFSYAELLAALFSSGVGQIFHIGDLPSSQTDQICADIAANGQDASRVIFLPNTPSLATTLIEISPDFYLGSHPVSGGKATVEALSVGLPVLFIRPRSALPFLTVDMTFNTSVTVSDLTQMPAAVRRLETEKITLAKRSRAIYEEHYSPKAFRKGLLSAINIEA